MSRALVLLIRFRYFGGWRSFLRSGRGSVIAWLGKVAILAYLLSIALGWVYGVWFALTKPENHPILTWLRSRIESHAQLAPIPLFVLLAVTSIFALFERPFRLSPAEAEFLQAGPFSRRQILGYKIGADFSALVVLALLGAPLGTAVFSFVSCFLGILLALTFAYLLQLFVSSLATTVGVYSTKGPLRLALLLVMLSALAALIWFPFLKGRENPVALSRAVTQSPGWWLALTPMRWFIEIIMAKQIWPDLVQRVALCLAIDGVLLAAVYALDAHTQRREDEVDPSAVDEEPAAPVPMAARWSFPLRTSDSGVAPLAWRQAMNVIRSPQQVAFALIMHATLLVISYIAIRYGKGLVFLPTLDGHLEVNPAGAWVCGILGIMLAMMVAAGLAFDFRGDMGRMDVLKALPMSPFVVVAGQLFVPVLIASVMQWALIADIALALRGVPSALWVIAAFVPPSSVVLMAIENLPLFWFPVRHTPGSKPEPFEAFGHILLHPFLRVLGYAVAAGATLLVAVLALLLSGQDAVALVAAWLTLAATGAALVALLTHTFDRFDVTQDVAA